MANWVNNVCWCIYCIRGQGGFRAGTVIWAGRRCSVCQAYESIGTPTCCMKRAQLVQVCFNLMKENSLSRLTLSLRAKVQMCHLRPRFPRRTTLLKARPRRGHRPPRPSRLLQLCQLNIPDRPYHICPGLSISAIASWSRAPIILDSGDIPPPWTIDGRKAAYCSSTSLDIRHSNQRPLFLLPQPSAKEKEF
jgi:hypothetical protein